MCLCVTDCLTGFFVGVVVAVSGDTASKTVDENKDDNKLTAQVSDWRHCQSCLMTSQNVTWQRTCWSRVTTSHHLSRVIVTCYTDKQSIRYVTLRWLYTCDQRSTNYSAINKRWSRTLTDDVYSILISGVTRVGVTRGANWRCHPIFPPKKLTTFLVIALCKVMTFFSCRLVTTPTVLHRLSPAFFCSF